MKVLLAIDKAFHRVEGWTVIVLLTAMVLLSFAQVILRNVFSSGLLWAEIVLRHLVLWIGFLGAALATTQERHINVDALTRFLTPRIKGAMAVLTDLFAAVVCFLLYRAATTFLEFEMADKNEVLEGIPSVYAQVIIPAGFLLITLHFVVRLFVSASQALGKGGAE